MEINKEEVKLRVAFYLRVSTDEQAEKFGSQVQREALEALLKSKNQSLVFAGENYVYFDDGISGTMPLDERPMFSQLKWDYLNAEDGNKPFDMVAVYKIDRFARKLKILMDVLEFFENYKISFMSANESIDTSTPFGRAMIGILGVIAELERENILDRTSGGRAIANQTGVVMGAHAAYGYKKDKDKHLEIFEEEASVVRRIFDLFVTNQISPQGIADLLIEEKAMSPEASAVHFGKRSGEVHKKNDFNFWRMEAVRSILMDEVYTGILYFDKSKKGVKLPKKEWQMSNYRHEPIIPQQLFDFAQIRLKALSTKKILTQRKIDNHIYLLSGLLKCDHCRKLGAEKESETSWTGAKDKISNNPIQYSYAYQCNRKNRKKYQNICPVIPIPAKSLDEYVIDFVKRLLENPKATFEYQKNRNATNLAINHLKEDRNRFLGLYNGIPQRKINILKQHELGAFDSLALKEKLKELEQNKNDCLKKMEEIDFRLSNETISRGYELSFELYSEKYKKALEKAENDNQELYEIVHRLINQIIVYARPKTENDSIAGRKKNDQLIPDRIDIYLNLPQVLLQELYTQKFGVKIDNV